MSARDAESGSSTYKGGSGSAGGIGNGGVGGGMGGGGNYGMSGSLGGAARNGGYAADRTGMYTGTTMYGNTAFGHPGGWVGAYATRARNGSLSNFRAPNGMPLSPEPAVTQRPLNRPTVPGILSPPTTVPAVAPPPSLADIIMSMPNYMPSFMDPIYGPNWYNTPQPTKQFYDRVPQDPNWRAPTIKAGSLTFQGPQPYGPGGDQWGPTPSMEYDHSVDSQPW